jgi:hypothetical protein
MIRTMKYIVIIGFLFCIQAALLANGFDQIIYDNGGPTGPVGILSDLDSFQAGSSTVTNERASDFIIGSGFSVTDFHWWGIYGGMQLLVPIKSLWKMTFI